jgi:hypothetical protein
MNAETSKEVRMANTTWNAGRWNLGLDAVTDQEKKSQCIRLLIEEFKEVSCDWRLRDKYVEDKFIHSVFLFTMIAALIGIAIRFFADSSIGEIGVVDSIVSFGMPAGFVVFGVLFFFALVMLISLVKDTYYRDGSERLSRLILSALEAELDFNAISVLRAVAADPGPTDAIFGDEFGPFTRKIKAPPESKAKTGIPLPVESFLSRRRTFRWITAFYTSVTVGCLALSITFLVIWVS